MRNHLRTARNTVIESGFPLVVLVVVLFGGVQLTYAQTAEGRPVARLVTVLPIPEARPRQAKSGKSSVNAPLIKSPSLEEASAIERRVFEQTNSERKRQGLQPLIWDAALCRMARIHSQDMSRVGSFTHLSADGSRLRERAEAVGIVHYTVLGENIAYNLGYDDPGGFAVERWMLSPKHRANILYTEFKSMAVGTFVSADGSVFLTQTFLTR
jgi:uncharacterized protein YkwD